VPELRCFHRLRKNLWRKIGQKYSITRIDKVEEQWRQNSPETISNRSYNRNTNTNTDSDDHLIRYASSASVDDVVWCGSSR